MKRRMIAALAALGLTALTLVGVAPPATADDAVGAPYVAIGDSVASGNGLMPYYDRDCLRSNKAYPSLVAGMMGGDVVSAACSGSSTMAVKEQALALIAQERLGLATQVVTITAGVNDLPWISVLGACSNLGSSAVCQAVMGGIGSAGPGIAGGVANIIATVRAAAPTARIVVTGYPQLFGSFEGSCSVGAAAPGTPMRFEAANAQLINGGVLGLNQAVQGGIGAYQGGVLAATGHGDPRVTYADVTGSFAGHGLCDTGDRWISGLISGKPKDRGFHPNVAGQQAYAAAVAAGLATMP